MYSFPSTSIKWEPFADWAYTGKTPSTYEGAALLKVPVRWGITFLDRSLKLLEFINVVYNGLNKKIQQNFL